MPLADWTVPFKLLSTRYAATALDLNIPIANLGTYYLNEAECKLRNTVRSTKTFIPQEDGAILHRRFVGGMEMDLAIQLWASKDAAACNEQAEEMLDVLMGYLYGLLNAEDNNGRMSWLPDGLSSPTSNYRMLEDIRLLSYPEEARSNGILQINCTVDTVFPYSEDETQLAPTLPGPVVNNGNRPTYPVWQVTGSSWIMVNDSTGEQIDFDDARPGCPDVGGGYVEINTIRNTAFLNGNGADMLPGFSLTDSDFFLIPPGTHNISGATGIGLINAAWS